MDKKVLLSVKDLDVKFHVRGRVLTAIRGISLDIYENESIAIVGESGSGKSVCTKSLLTSILNMFNEDEADVFLIDFKLVELNLFKNCNGI